MAATSDELLASFRAGELRALSRLLTWAEREDAAFADVYDNLAPARGQARRVGITGPPGAGKSTLVNALVAARRAADERVAVLAVDPSSPFTGGALLGDRVRMHEHVLDSGVFVRSMATRGSLGGLSRASLEAADLMDVFGFPHVLVETVGVGQIEHDVVEACDLVVVVLSPGAGDGVQALKAGLMELADVFVVNKSDLPEADRLVREIEEMLALRLHRKGEEIPIVRCTAVHGEGVDELLATIDARFDAFVGDGTLRARRSARARMQIRRLVEDGLRRRLWAELELDASIAPNEGEQPYAAAERVLGGITAGQQSGVRGT